MVVPNTQQQEGEQKTEVRKFSEISELQGKLKISDEAQKLMRSVMENDKKTVDDGKLVKEAYNQGMGSFVPDMMFEKLVQNFQFAKQLYGETMIRLLTGYDPSYIEKNISVPEFQKMVKKAVEKKISRLRKENLLDDDNQITDIGEELAMIVMAAEELENIMPKGSFGEKYHKKSSIYGEKGNYKEYKKGVRYRDVAIKRSVKTAIRRGHSALKKEDLKAFERERKGRVTVVYAIDSSGSMKGSKIDAAKRAGVALSYKAVNEKDKVGLIVFGEELKESVKPTEDFGLLIKKLTKIKASKETNMVVPLEKSAEMFSPDDETKHLIIITDALPTAGENPEKETIDTTAEANAKGVTVSIVGIGIDEKGRKLGRKISEAGKGKFYIAKNTDEIDKIVLEDYSEIF